MSPSKRVSSHFLRSETTTGVAMKDYQNTDGDFAAEHHKATNFGKEPYKAPSPPTQQANAFWILLVLLVVTLCG